MITGLIIVGAVLLFGLSHLVTFYLMGKAFFAIEAQRDSYRKIALLAVDDATETKKALNEVLDAILEATEKPAKKSVARSSVGKREEN